MQTNTTTVDSATASLLLFLFCVIPLIIMFITILIVVLKRLPQWRAAHQERQQKSKEQQQASHPPQQQEETMKGKEVTPGEPVIHITWDGLTKWYLTEGHSIDGVTPLNALPTMKEMVLGKIQHGVAALMEPEPEPVVPQTLPRLQHLPPGARKASPFAHIEEVVEEPEPPIEEDEEEEPISENETPLPEPVSFSPMEEEEPVIGEHEELEQTTHLFPSRSLPPTLQDIPFKALAQVDPIAFQEEVMRVYLGALQKQEEQPNRPLTREVIGIQGARWKHLFSNPDGILRTAGFVTDHPTDPGFVLDQDLERLSTFLQNYQPEP